jgi:AraC family transcriptional regulator, arabinose operon regulatory protein
MDKQDIYLYFCDMADYSRTRINRLARFYCKKDWYWEARGRSLWTGEQRYPVRFNYNLWTVLQGHGTLTAPDGTFEIKTDDCFILRGDEHYRAEHDSADPLVVFAVHFDYLDKKGKVIHPKTRLHRRIRHPAFFANLLDRMEAAWREGNKADAEYLLGVCLMEIERNDRSSAFHGYKAEQSSMISRICEEIRREPGKEYSMKQLAGKMNCTRYHFARIFKTMTGSSPNDFIIETRIEAAKGLLHSSSYTIGRIAEIVGYRDIYFFSRQFKTRTGVTPSSYRGT